MWFQRKPEEAPKEPVPETQAAEEKRGLLNWFKGKPQAPANAAPEAPVTAAPEAPSTPASEAPALEEPPTPEPITAPEAPAPGPRPPAPAKRPG